MEHITTATLQDQIKATLTACGLPADDIAVYGSQIVVTARSHKTARQWASLISKFATLRGMVESIDYNKVNTNTCLRPSMHKVWRVYGRIS